MPARPPRAGVLGFTTWSPRLDKLGNSVRGIDFAARISQIYNFHVFSSSQTAQQILKVGWPGRLHCCGWPARSAERCNVEGWVVIASSPPFLRLAPRSAGQSATCRRQETTHGNVAPVVVAAAAGNLRELERLEAVGVSP